MTTSFRDLSDRQLEFMAKRFEAQITALKHAATAAGVALRQQFTDKLDQVRAELERRRI